MRVILEPSNGVAGPAACGERWDGEVFVEPVVERFQASGLVRREFAEIAQEAGLGDDSREFPVVLTVGTRRRIE